MQHNIQFWLIGLITYLKNYFAILHTVTTENRKGGLTLATQKQDAILSRAKVLMNVCLIESRPELQCSEQGKN